MVSAVSTRLAIWLGVSTGGNGQPPSDLQARLETQSCEFPMLFKTAFPFCLHVGWFRRDCWGSLGVRFDQVLMSMQGCHCQWQCFFPLSFMSLLQVPVVAKASPFGGDSDPPYPKPPTTPTSYSASKSQAMPRPRNKIQLRELARRKRCKHHFPLHLTLLLAADDMLC